MTSLKKIFSSLLLLLVVCQFNQLPAHDSAPLPVYQNVLGHISLGYDDAMLVGAFKDESGLIFRVIDYSSRDDGVFSTWHPGDTLNFKAHKKGDALVLSVKRINGADRDAVEPYVIFDVINSSKSSLAISEIKDGGKYVVLNDKSVWHFGWCNQFHTKKWKIGERVLVAGRGDKNSYEFINLDAPVSENVFSATASFVVQVPQG